MLVAVMSLLLTSITPVETSLYPVERLRLVERGELKRHLHVIEDELIALRRPIGLQELISEATTKVTPFVMSSCLPALGIALLYSQVPFAIPVSLGVAAVLPIGIALAAALVFIVGSVFEYLIVLQPSMHNREERLEAYRGDVVRALGPPRPGMP